MPTLLPALSGLLLSLVGCGGRQSLDAAPLTAWPEGPVILLRVDAGLIVVNPDEGGPRRLTTTPATTADDALNAAPALFSPQLLTPTGLAWTLPLPKGAGGASLSPDGRSVAYTAPDDKNGARVRRMGVDGLGDEPVSDQGGEVTWLVDGQLGMRDGDALAGRHIVRVGADGAGLTVLATGGQRALKNPSFTPGGEAVVFVAMSAGDRPGESTSEVLWADGVNERALLSLGSGADAWAPKVSPDGKNVLVMARPPNPGGDRAPTNLYVGPIGPTAEPLRALLPLETKTPTFLPVNSAYKGVVAAAWSPDNLRLAFVAALAGDCRKGGMGELVCSYDLYVIDADGQNLRRLTNVGFTELPALRWAR